MEEQKKRPYYGEEKEEREGGTKIDTKGLFSGSFLCRSQLYRSGATIV